MSARKNKQRIAAQMGVTRHMPAVFRDIAHDIVPSME